MSRRNDQRGRRGIMGPRGKVGKAGRVGSKGSTGSKGATGKRGAVGAIGPSRGVGPVNHQNMLSGIYQQLEGIHGELEVQMKRMAQLQTEVNDVRERLGRFTGRSSSPTDHHLGARLR
jgi:hypothetical protein